MSHGSSLRPRRDSISDATGGTSGDDITASSMARTRASGICRSSSKRRAMSVGAGGEYLSIRRAGREVLGMGGERLFALWVFAVGMEPAWPLGTVVGFLRLLEGFRSGD